MYIEKINYQHNSYSCQHMKRLSYMLAAKANFLLKKKHIKNKKGKEYDFVCKYSSATLPIINILEFWLLKLICIMKDVNWMLIEVAGIKLIL